ncbi:MAG: DEAD/DEAH box helicase family protein [Gammaproteobacteria bacterium]
MTAFVTKEYQAEVLRSVQDYLRSCRDRGNANTAFYETTLALWGQGITYHPLGDFNPAMPYFCLRVPTGGGKTWLAARCVRHVNDLLLEVPHSVVLWLVPSNAIREQTLKALKYPQHPYHAALREAGPVTVLDIEEAKNVTPATLATSTTVIVCTRQAFQVEDTEGRKVYESNGALMAHFADLAAEQRQELLTDGNGVIPCSLANVLRLHRPFVIVDEAHNSRTDLGFDMLRRLNPSGILELTATPDTERTPSNVLHSVWAAELKAEHMIKLPILLEAQPDWQKCLNQALAWRNELQGKADAERRQGAAYLRPLVLIQAEPKRQGIETRNVDVVWEELQKNHSIPVNEIVRSTSEYDELEKIGKEYPRGIADERCPVKYVITQRALAEGWDCPFAYILVSMAELHAATAVEQLLGRILRQPDAMSRADDALNQSYAYVVSRSFRDTANSLRDSLVKGAGFERREAKDFVSARDPKDAIFDFERNAERVEFTPIAVALGETPEKRELKSLDGKVEWDDQEKKLVINAPLDAADTAAVQAAVKGEQARNDIAQAAEASRQQASSHFFQTPAEQGKHFEIPQLGLRVQGELQLFDDPEVLDYPWELSPYGAEPTIQQLQRLADNQAGEAGTIDTDEGAGTLRVDFMAGLTRDLELSYRPEHMDEAGLAAWFCRNLPDPTITHTSKRAFVVRWISSLLKREGMNLARLNARKFLLRQLLQDRIRELRLTAVRKAYQETLFEAGSPVDVVVGGEGLTFDFPEYGYAPTRTYDGRFGPAHFRKHYYAQVGDFDSKEEYECACWLDDQAQKGRIEFWVRNLARKPACSFFLQKAADRFWPDFICKLPGGAVLAIEYKGADRYSTDEAKEDRLIGELWARESKGKARFVMVTNKQWGTIAGKLG